MNKLRNAACYLAGPIDFCKTSGTDFRIEIQNKLNHIGIKWLDPTNKPFQTGQEVGKEKEHHQKLRSEGKWEELSKFAKEIRRVDLRMTDKCDFLICYLDTDIFSFGSLDELLSVEDQQKPVFLVVKQGKSNISLWAFAVLPHEHIFSSIDDLVKYLEGIDNGTIPMGRKWVEIWPFI